MAGTGTLAWAVPAGPSAVKRTCQEPEAISQSEPVKKAGSAVERCMASAVGGWVAASPVRGVGVMLRALTVAGGADLDEGDAGNDVGWADGDEELVGAGGDLLEDVLAADVGLRRDWRTRGRRAEAGGLRHGCRELHRCTPRIQRPKARPIQVEMEA